MGLLKQNLDYVVTRFYARSQNCQKRLLTSSCMSVRMEQLDCFWTDFHEIWYLRVWHLTRKFKSHYKMWQKVELLYMKTYVHLWYYVDEFFVERDMFQIKAVDYLKTYVHLWYYVDEFFVEGDMFQIKAVDYLKTHILGSIIFFLDNRAVWEITWKNMVERDGPQITVWYGACALHAG
jgi:hypothetical protein